MCAAIAPLPEDLLVLYMFLLGCLKAPAAEEVEAEKTPTDLSSSSAVFPGFPAILQVQIRRWCHLRKGEELRGFDDGAAYLTRT